MCTCTLPVNVFVLGKGFLKTFFDKTKNMTPEERGKYLEDDEVGYIVLYNLFVVLMYTCTYIHVHVYNCVTLPNVHYSPFTFSSPRSR